MRNTYMYYDTDGIKYMTADKIIDFHIWRLLVELIDDGAEYNNPTLEKNINVIIKRLNEIPVKIIDELIKALTRHDKTELVLQIIRTMIELKEKERFEL